MRNYILFAGALLGLTSVGVGAYVDHVLTHVDFKTLSSMKTALHYHELYAVVISLIGLQCFIKKDAILMKISGWIFIVGTFLFSFGIYLKVFTGVMVLTKVTPIGGTLLMIGWILLACASIKMEV